MRFAAKVKLLTNAPIWMSLDDAQEVARVMPELPLKILVASMNRRISKQDGIIARRLKAMDQEQLKIWIETWSTVE